MHGDGCGSNRRYKFAKESTRGEQCSGRVLSTARKRSKGDREGEIHGNS